jgi:hypothetical protein
LHHADVVDTLSLEAGERLVYEADSGACEQGPRTFAERGGDDVGGGERLAEAGGSLQHNALVAFPYRFLDGGDGGELTGPERAHLVEGGDFLLE